MQGLGHAGSGTRGVWDSRGVGHAGCGTRGWPGHGCRTYSVFGWQVHGVGVEVLEKGTVHWVRKLVYFYHLLHILVPVRLEHGPKVLTPKQNTESDLMKVRASGKHHRSPQLLPSLGPCAPGSRLSG